MHRREFLQDIGAAIALALVPGTAGASTLGGPRLDGLGKADAGEVAQALRERTLAIRKAEIPPWVGDFAEARGFERTLPVQALAAIWVTSTFRDLPAKMRRKPEIQSWIKDEGPAVTETVFGLTELLEGLSADERANFAATLQDEPDLAEALSAGLAAKGAGTGVESERFAQSEKLAEHTLWRMRHQSLSGLIDEYVDRVDKICKRQGIEREGWRERLAAERTTWDALAVVSDPDNPEIQEAASVIGAADLAAPIGVTGGHLGVVLDGTSHRKGALVQAVMEASPAHRAGLEVGDRIEGVDGQTLDPLQLVGWLSTRSPEKSVALSVRRKGEHLEVEAELAPGPGDRIAVDNLRGSKRTPDHPTIRAGYRVFGIGAKILGGGAALFVLGLIFMAIGGDIEAGIGALGAGMTIVGILVMMLGLGILILGGLVMLAGQAQQRRAPRPPPPPPPPPEPEPEETKGL